MSTVNSLNKITCSISYEILIRSEKSFLVFVITSRLKINCGSNNEIWSKNTLDWNINLYQIQNCFCFIKKKKWTISLLDSFFCFLIKKGSFCLHNSSLSKLLLPLPKRPLKKPRLGASGVSTGRKRSPSISCKFSLKKKGKYRLWNLKFCRRKRKAFLQMCRNVLNVKCNLGKVFPIENMLYAIKRNLKCRYYKSYMTRTKWWLFPRGKLFIGRCVTQYYPLHLAQVTSGNYVWHQQAAFCVAMC